MEGQNHPLYSVDRNNLDRLLSKEKPSDEDLIDLARLAIRYENFPGAQDLKMDMIKILKMWGFSKDELHNLTREIWQKGYRPDSSSSDVVGSSFDTSENSVT